ncbi:transposase [Streptomyces sp. NPDC008121]|uniref:transposase n=1 Tax=Streptomyces sp. NPDC008121 TaxID=3364809 RepID=UPI0036F09191
MTARALRFTAHSIQALQAEAKDPEKDILTLARGAAPELPGLPGTGPVTAAQILLSRPHQGRFRPEAAFAPSAGASPVPASSGLTNRHPPQPQRRPAAQPGHPHHHPDSHAAPLRHKGVHRPQNHRGQHLPRRTAMPQAHHLPPDLQDPRTDSPNQDRKHRGTCTSCLTRHSSPGAVLVRRASTVMASGILLVLCDSGGLPVLAGRPPIRLEVQGGFCRAPGRRA